jgi:hypothetical protein
MSKDIKQFNDIVESTIKGKWKNAAKMCYECNFDAADLIHMNENVKDCELGYEEDDEYITSNYWRNKYHLALLIEMKYKYINKLKEITQ